MNRIIQKFLILMLVSPTIAFCANPNHIKWYDWEPAAFEAAVQQDKLIMVNVGHEGCTACRYMENNTFTNAEVIDILNKNFISIQVDSEARPDIGERYSDWAWPATAFMRPDRRQVLALRGSLRPQRFIPILDDLIAKHAANALTTDEREPYIAPATTQNGPLDGLLDQVRAQLDRSFNDEIGGWGSAKVLEFPEPSLQFLARGYWYDNKLAHRRGMQNAHGFAQQLDEVWGGIFYASFNSWGNTVKEKRTESQAAALQIFAAALQQSNDQIFRHKLALIDRYLVEHMRDADGLYYASQKDLIEGQKSIDMDAYYGSSDKDRRAIGLPSTDHARYTDLNARLMEAYVRAFAATGDSKYQQRAIGIATALLKRQTESGWFLQLTQSSRLAADSRVHVLRIDERPYLRTQVYMGRALLALYQITSDPTWINAAQRTAQALRSQLEDPTAGGFFAAGADGTEDLVARRKPLEDNAVAAQFLYLLGILQKDASFVAAAEKAVRASAAPAIVKREGRITGNLAIALEMLNAGYVEFSVVGDSNDKNAKALLRAANALFEPRKIVHFEAPGRYPEKAHAALYICNEQACSLPITDPEIVDVEAAKFIPVAFAKANGSAFKQLAQ